LFVRFGSWSDVVEALTVWDGVERFQKDASLRTSIGLALGWRLFSMSAEEAAAARPEIGRMVDTPAGVWLQLALGDTRTAATSHAGFEGLARAYPMAEAGRLPRPSVARLLEAALWHEGGHPGRAALDLHRQLQAELVIDGSAASGEGYAQRRGVQVYTAKGVARSDSPLFLVANELYRFIRREEPWSLREHRLR